jgi:hypothetical protein
MVSIGVKHIVSGNKNLSVERSHSKAPEKVRANNIL